MLGWKLIRLGDICKTNENSYYPKDNWKFVNYLDTGSLTENKITELQYINTKTDKMPSRARRKVIKNSILYSTVRPNQLHYGIIKEPVDNLLVSTGFTVIDVDTNKAIPEFIYYLLIQNNTTEQLQAIAEQSVSTYPSIKPSDIENLEFKLPNLIIQSKIVSILDTIDSKICQNEKINNNLEQQAQAIFKEWFIDNPENNEWSTGTFSELIKSTLNGDWGKEAPTGNNTEKVYCIRGADIPEVKAGNKGKMPTRYILPKNYVAKQLTAGDIVVEISGGSPTQSTGRCTAITQSLLDRYDSGMVCTNFCKALKPKEGYSLFIYYYWQYMYGKGVFFSYENGTTGIKNLDFSGFIETETILIPPIDKITAFDNYCNSIFSQIFANGKQNEHLAVLRDTLLPKLMSGELDVSNIDL
jgi:type I restriction enzyme S subunit